MFTAAPSIRTHQMPLSWRTPLNRRRPLLLFTQAECHRSRRQWPKPRLHISLREHNTAQAGKHAYE
jgi:hypothetical protein